VVAILTDYPTKLFKQRSKNFVRVFCMLLMAICIGQSAYAQTCNAVINGTFTGITGWTVLAAGITPNG
jgi:hypothetical protein